MGTAYFTGDGGERFEGILMADKGHLDLLKKSVEEWNRWRKENPDIKPDLSNVNLTYAELGGADLTEANLWEANLKNAKLTEAQMSRADLCFANLGGADLKGAAMPSANLTEADLAGADLTGADLTGINGWGANFSGADLTSVNLAGAELSDANFAQSNLTRASLNEAELGNVDFTKALMKDVVVEDVDLSRIRGAHTVRCEGTPRIDLKTLQRSKGNIPEAFLRAADIPEHFTTAVRGLFASLPSGVDPKPPIDKPASVRSLLLRKNGDRRLPEVTFTVITANKCPLYGTAEQIRLSGQVVSFPGAKETCAILVDDIVTSYARSADPKPTGTTFSCSGCTGRIRLAAKQAEKEAPGRKLDKEVAGLIKLLSTFSIFETLDEMDIEYLVSMLRFAKFGEGETILRKGEPGKNLYLIVSGQVEVQGDGGMSIAVMGKGEIFGEMSLLSGRPVGATIKVVEAARLLYLEGTDFRQILDQFPSLQMYFTQLLAQRLTEIHDARSEEYQSGMVGKLSDLPPAELMQTLNVNQKTGVLKLKLSRGSASAAFREGALIRASYDGKTDKDAFYEILQEKEGRFKFVPGLGEEYTNAEEMGDFMWLLMEGLKRIDETSND